MVKNKQITVVVGLVLRNGRILMLKRHEPELSDVHLKWEFPGGKVDFGETPEEAVKREILEETGIDAEVIRLLPLSFTQNWNYSWGVQQTLLFGFDCAYIKEEKRMADHHVAEVRWMDLKEVKKLERLPGVDFFIDILGR